MKKAVILQYYDDTFTEKEGKKKKSMKPPPQRALGVGEEGSCVLLWQATSRIQLMLL